MDLFPFILIDLQMTPLKNIGMKPITMEEAQFHNLIRLNSNFIILRPPEEIRGSTVSITLPSKSTSDEQQSEGSICSTLQFYYLILHCC